MINTLKQTIDGHNHRLLMDIVRRVEVARESRDFLSLQDELFAIDLTQQSRIVLIAVLRYTYAVRSHCPRWNELHDNIRDELIKRADNWKRSLVGLSPVDKN